MLLSLPFGTAVCH